VAHLILTGFMGTGKTEVGRRLARALGRAFVDTDRLVEAKTGRSVAAIFADDGEAAFRALERDAVAEACGLPDAVIATGGGALVDPENRRRLAAAGPIVCLTATPEEILRRVGRTDTRPLLAGLPSDEARIERIREMLASRAGAYGSATHVVDTSDCTPDQVVQRVRTVMEAR
jgi:shikimate kinase